MKNGTGRLTMALLLAAGVALAGCDSGNVEDASQAASVTSQTASARAGGNWADKVVETPEYGFLRGNPNAKVKVVEFASFTCPHCREFYVESEDALTRDYISTGRISYEFRPFALNLQDMIATNLATCEGSGRFYAWTNALFRKQESWIKPYMELKQPDIDRISGLSSDKQLLALAEAGKFQDFARGQGMPKAKFDSCISNEKRSDQMTNSQQKAIDTYKITGTPTFIVNGEKLEGVTTWAGLKADLDRLLK